MGTHVPMAQRMHVIVSDRQYSLLVEERAQRGISMCELIRQAIDRAYRPNSRPRVNGFELSFRLHRPVDPRWLERRPGSPRVL